MASKHSRVHKVLFIAYGILANPDNDQGIKDDPKDEHSVHHNVQFSTPVSETNSDSDNNQCEPTGSDAEDDIEHKMYQLTESDPRMAKRPVMRQSSSGEFGSPGPPVVTNVHPSTPDSSAPSTLSTDDLTLDAAMVRPPQRSGPGQIKKEIDEDEDKEDKTESGDDLQNLKKAHTDKPSTEEKHNSEEMEEFIKQLIAKGNKSKADESIKLFDAAVIYDKNDYAEVSNFIEQVKTMVKSELGEEVRIEFYDSEVFSQSQIVVVEDLINKCSIVLAYLTTNCSTETFNLLCEEGIGLSRLALNNPDVLANRMRNDKEFIMKPVHTAHPTERYYRTPIGLVTVNGIDWYDRHSAHTRSKIVSTMKTAIITRKRREEEVNTTESYRKAIRGNANVPHMKSASGSKPSMPYGTPHIPTGNSTVAEDAMSMGMSHPSIGSFPSQMMPVQGMPPHGHNAMQRPDQMLYGPPSIQAQQYSPLPSYQQSYMAQLYQGHTQYPGYQMTSFPANQGMQYPLMPGGAYSGMNAPNAQFQNMPGSGYITQANNAPSFAQVPGMPMPQQNQYYGNVPMPQNQPSGHPAAMMNAYGQQYTSYGSQDSLPYQQGQPNLGPPAQMGQFPQFSNSGFNQQQLPQQFEHGQQQQDQRPNLPPYQPPVQQLRLQEQHPPQVQQSRYSSASSSAGLYANDAPPSDELRVVSKVTGKLIVHPNLSTDDVEVDTAGIRATANTDQQFRQREPLLKSKPKTDSKFHTSTRDSDEDDDCDTDDESDTDDDGDDTPLANVKHKLGKNKNKSINIAGCKYVQLGHNNRIQEQKKVVSKQPGGRIQSPEVQDVSDRFLSDTSKSKHFDDAIPVMEPSSAPKKPCDRQHLDTQTYKQTCGSDTSIVIPLPNSNQPSNASLSALPSHVHERKEGPLNNVNMVSIESNDQHASEFSSGISEDCLSPLDSICDNDLFGTNEDGAMNTTGSTTVLTHASFSNTSDNRTDSQTSTFSFSQFGKSFRRVATVKDYRPTCDVQTTNSDVD